jgi:hypothetical protein
MRKLFILLFILLISTPAFAKLKRDDWKIARDIVLPQNAKSGWVYLPLDDKALAVPDMASYRIVSKNGEEVPYRMAVEDGQLAERPFAAHILSTSLPGLRGVEVVVELTENSAGVNELRLNLVGDNFRSRVRVEGSHDRSKWLLLQDNALVYRHEGRFEATRVILPPNSYKFLRLNLSSLQGEVPRVAGVNILTTVLTPRKLVEVPATLSRKEDAKEQATILDLKLATVTPDLVLAKFDIAEPVFDRTVRIDVRSVVTSSGTDPYYTINTNQLIRLSGHNEITLTLDSTEALRALRFTVFNGNDKALTIRKVTLWRTRRGLIFSAHPDVSYQLWYDRPNVTAPDYDIQRLPLNIQPARLPMASLGPEQILPPKPPPPPPLSEKYPIIFWSALGAVVILLGLLILRSMRNMKNASQN